MDNLGVIAPADDDTSVSPSPHLPLHGRAWPSLQHLVLAPEACFERRHFIGGSDANIILSADPEKILRLWREKRAETEPEDLSCCLPVMLGCWTETFNRHWFEQLTGERICEVGLVVDCDKQPWRRCTLDGTVESSGAVWEAKHTSAFAKPEEVLERYMPQLQHNMAVVGSERAVLSVIFGNHKFEIMEVAADWLYQIELLDAEADFWDCVQTGRLPVPVQPPPPPKGLAVREICFEGNNAWASAAFGWLEHREAAKAHAAAVSAIKQLVDDDVKRAFGHGVDVRRSKSGAITIRELA